jgi:uncharacterized protein
MAGPAGRDPAIDATRGLALLGILIANISFFAMPGGVAGTWWREVYSGWTDIAATFVVRTLFENTFILIFSFLFGCGAARQLAARRPPGSDGGLLASPLPAFCTRCCSGPAISSWPVRCLG